MNIDLLYDRVGVPIWQHRAEFVALLKWVRAEGIRSVLELGTGYGGSAFLFGEVTDHGKVVTVDNASVVKNKHRRQQPNLNFVQLIGDSRSDKVEACVAAYAPFDLVYFDAEHSYVTAQEHYRRYVKYATRAIVQHDTNMDEEAWSAREPEMAGIVRAWRELTLGRTTLLFHQPAPDPRFPRWGGLGVMYVDG